MKIQECGRGYYYYFSFGVKMDNKELTLSYFKRALDQSKDGMKTASEINDVLGMSFCEGYTQAMEWAIKELESEITFQKKGEDNG